MTSVQITSLLVDGNFVGRGGRGGGAEDDDDDDDDVVVVDKEFETFSNNPDDFSVCVSAGSTQVVRRW